MNILGALVMTIALMGGPFSKEGLKRIDTGGSESYEVDGHIIRFHTQDPSQPYSVSELADIVNSLRPALHVQIPDYHLSLDKTYLWSKKIPGEELKVALPQLDELKKQTLAHDLARFIFDMQQAVSDAEIHDEHAFTIPHGTAPRVLKADRLDEKLQEIFKTEYSDLKPYWDSIYPAYVKALQDLRFSGIVHNDLHISNILVDPDTGHLSGVIDFAMTARGNVFREMRFLYSLSSDFVKDVATEYCYLAHIDDVDDFLKKVELFRSYRDFCNLVKVVHLPKEASDGDRRSPLYLRGMRDHHDPYLDTPRL